MYKSPQKYFSWFPSPIMRPKVQLLAHDVEFQRQERAKSDRMRKQLLIPQGEVLGILKFKPLTFVLHPPKNTISPKNNHSTSSPTNPGLFSFSQRICFHFPKQPFLVWRKETPSLFLWKKKLFYSSFFFSPSDRRAATANFSCHRARHHHHFRFPLPSNSTLLLSTLSPNSHCFSLRFLHHQRRHPFKLESFRPSNSTTTILIKLHITASFDFSIADEVNISGFDFFIRQTLSPLPTLIFPTNVVLVTANKKVNTVVGEDATTEEKIVVVASSIVVVATPLWATVSSPAIYHVLFSTNLFYYNFLLLHFSSKQKLMRKFSFDASVESKTHLFLNSIFMYF